MIVSTDQQAFSVTILVKAEEGPRGEVGGEGEEEGERTVVGEGDHGGRVLEGLAGLREQGLLVDTRLWAQGQAYQVTPTSGGKES